MRSLGSSPGCARSRLSPWKKLFTRIFSPYVICNDSSSVMLPRELRKVQWLEWPVRDPICKALRALSVDSAMLYSIFFKSF